MKALVCDTVYAPDTIDFGASYFALFGLPSAFRIDAAALDKRFREILTHVHPDYFAQAGETERRVALQCTTRVIEAYQTLKNPLSRACYLLEEVGQSMGRENNLAMPSEFLTEQMEWREAAAEAREARDIVELEQLHDCVRLRMKEGYDQLAGLLDDRHDYTMAADYARRLMFLEKLLAEIDDGIAAIE